MTEQREKAAAEPPLDCRVMRARLEIKRSLAPANLWHWAVILEGGHVFVMSSESFESAEICMADASGAGLDALHGAEMVNEDGYKRTNRENRMAPKRGLFWCWKCDRQIVAVGEKCPACGAKNRKRTLKKETSA